jgi:excisionase family DNA binding protein
MSTNEDHLTIHEATGVLGVHRRTLYRYIKRGLIASFKHAGRTYINRSEIDAYFARLQMEGDKYRAAAERRARKAA